MFKDRFDAAYQLAQELEPYKNRSDVVIVAIPRGALQIGVVLAQELNAPLELFFSKKIGAPGHSEYAIGAVTAQDVYITPEFERAEYKPYIDAEVKRLRQVLEKRKQDYYRGKEPLSLRDKIVIVVDDGIATGRTMLLALQMIKKQHPKKLVLAVPIAPSDSIDMLTPYVDELVVLVQPITFLGISQFYQNFEQIHDEEAIQLFNETRQ